VLNAEVKAELGTQEWNFEVSNSTFTSAFNIQHSELQGSVNA
jgi:hypothetical protein